MGDNDATDATTYAEPALLRGALGRAAPALRDGLWRLGAAALDLVFPPSCLACRKATAGHGGLCPDCWGAIHFIDRPYCERLGTPFPYDLGIEGLHSPDAIANPPVYARARAVARFEDGPARTLVHRLKYSDRMELAKPLGLWMARAGQEILAEADLLVPVPLHRRRLIWRQFNQANALALSVAGVCGKPVDPFVLLRVKPTAPQVGLTRASAPITCRALLLCRKRRGFRSRAAPWSSSTT